MPNFKTEHAFNTYITEHIKRLGTSYKIIKTSDRFKMGISDWLLFHKGLCVAIESKYIMKVPSKGNLLKHPVSGPQRTFLHGMDLAGIRGFILLGIEEEGCMYLFHPGLLYTGNMAVSDFKEEVTHPDFNTRFDFAKVREMVACLFAGTDNG